jgi:NTP pyrophosphatase (non-canonical NTP hydrolase)
MMEERLIDVIRKPDFNAELFKGFMISDFQFMRFFPLNEESLRQTFDRVNIFLSENGFDELSFDAFLPELSVTSEPVTLYADTNCNETNKQLILVIEKYSPNTNPIDQIILKLLQFRNERDWEQFHNPKDLALAINVEAGELLELFLWKNADEANNERVKEELADIFAFSFLLAEKYQFDVKDIVLEKIKKNAEKYPVAKAKGTAKKYNEL